MKLKPIDSTELIQLVAGWMSVKENYQWLDFGNGKQSLSAAWLKIKLQQDSDVIRVFTPDDSDTAIGVVGLSHVNRHFKTAALWVVLGDKTYSRQGYTTRAMSKMLTVAFQEYGLGTVNTWVVEGNTSTRPVERLNFKRFGRQRQCHDIDGQARDRVWFDLLASEHKEL